MECTHCSTSASGTTANPFIDRWFHDCLYTDQDWVGFTLQLISIGAWVVAMVPQIIHNYKTESAEALSPWFLADWLVGDSSNLAGCLLTGTQLPLTTGTAWYYICCDVLLIGQYTFYAAKQARRIRREEHSAKRARVRAAAQAGNAVLQQFDQVNTTHVGASCQPEEPRLHTVHSSPVALDQVDRAWHVHSVPMPEGTSHRGSGWPSNSAGSDGASSSQGQERSGQQGLTGGNRSAGGLVVTKALGFGPGLAIACAASVLLLVACAAWSPAGGADTSVDGYGGADLKAIRSRSWSSHSADSLSKSANTASPELLVGGEDWLEGSSMLQNAHDVPHCRVPRMPTWTHSAGLILGYISTIAYLKSRVVQLVKNCTRGDAEGLSANMFLCAITGNVTGAAGILWRLNSAEGIVWQLPWLLGMLGTVAMDTVITLQSHTAAARHVEPDLVLSTSSIHARDGMDNVHASEEPSTNVPLIGA